MWTLLWTLLSIYRPCFEPLVWTHNDENGGNEPDLGELEQICAENNKCDPFCTPGPSQTCVKYSEWTGKVKSYTSQVEIISELFISCLKPILFQFCGKVTLDWSGSTSKINRCFRAGSQEYCFCDQNTQPLCNNSVRISLGLGIVINLAISVIFLLWFI